MAWIKGNIDPGLIEAMVSCLRDEKLHTSEVASRIGRSDGWVRYVASLLIDDGRGNELLNLQSYVRGTKVRIGYIESLDMHREVKLQREMKRQQAPEPTCRWCGLRGQLASVQGKQRTVCDSCQMDHDLRATNPDHTKTWRDDPRWVALIDRRHQDRGGCLVCGSSRAKIRDGRYCDWRHDPVMLTPEEFDALLERHSSVTRYDIWGNVLR